MTRMRLLGSAVTAFVIGFTAASLSVSIWSPDVSANTIGCAEIGGNCSCAGGVTSGSGCIGCCQGRVGPAKYVDCAASDTPCVTCFTFPCKPKCGLICWAKCLVAWKCL